MPLRLDNASALPTCPQLQQKQQQTADRNWPKNHPHDCAKKLNLFIPPPRNPKLVERYGIQDNKLILAVGRISSQERYKGFDDGTC
jgi:hypothetical protein